MQPKSFKSCIVVLLLFPMLSFAQSAATVPVGYKAGLKGLLYRIYNAHAGPKIKEGDFISFEVLVKSDRDSVLTNTYVNGNPAVEVVPKSNPGEVMSAFAYLTEGDSATVKVNVDSLSSVAKSTLPVKGKYIVYDLKIEKVIARDNVPDTVFNARVRDYITLQSAALKLAEPGKIKKHIADHKLSVMVTPSGLNYVITQPGHGDKIAVGDTAVMWYVARHVNGKIFETNIEALARQSANYKPDVTEYKALRYKAGANSAIAGWDEALLLLNKGAKATFIMPSALAYGEKGFNIIQPYTPLVFEIEVVDVVKALGNGH